MKILIEIPEDVYDTIMGDQMLSREQLAILQKHIYCSKPLPKGHGRLIDADALLEQFRDGTEGYDCAAYTRYEIGNIIDLEDTIIEADKGGGE